VDEVGSTEMQFVSVGSSGSQIFWPCLVNCLSASAARYSWMAALALSAPVLVLAVADSHGRPGYLEVSGNRVDRAPVPAANTCQ
jgi:hypothetical protein